MKANATTSDLTLGTALLRTCRRQMRRKKVADSTGMRLTAGDLLTRALIFRRLLRRHVLAKDEKCVGLLLPPSVGGVLANAAVVLDRRLPVNLNYTLSAEALHHCIKEAGIRQVLTSRKLVERLGLKLDAPLVFLEDLVPKVTWRDKLAGAAAALATPAPLLAWHLGLHHVKPDDLATIIFTSGSTGRPKGVMLSHANIVSNVLAMNEVASLQPHDVFLGILPFFHAFGFTCTLWGVLLLDIGGAYHYNPMETNTVAKLCRHEQVTAMIGTPTMLRLYLKRCDPDELAALEVVVAGAEKLPTALSDAFEEKFGIRPAEGYGTTECSPLVSVNVPPNRAHPGELSYKEGSVGRPIPRVEVRVVDIESGEPLGRDEEGMLQIRGPNVMQGYLNMPEETDKVLQDGWYTTGDIAVIDDDGFIRITDRLSRFSKLGGEMVPHLKIEEAIAKALGAGEEETLVVVTAVPDERKGERLVVLHKPIEMNPQEIRRALLDAGLPRLWVPAQDAYFEIDEFPLLGTGKIDLKRVRQMAEERLFATT